MRLRTAVSRALSCRELTGSDGAARELALLYARRIDEGEPLAHLGPLLLAVLDALGMTPKARNALVKGGDSGGGTSPLDELRQRRRARVDNTPPVDAAAP